MHLAITDQVEDARRDLARCSSLLDNIEATCEDYSRAEEALLDTLVNLRTVGNVRLDQTPDLLLILQKLNAVVRRIADET